MKKHLLIIAIITGLIMPFYLQAQNSAIDKLCKKYGDKDGFTVVNINKDLFNFEYNDQNEDEGEKSDKGDKKDFMKGMQSMRVITCEGDKSMKEQCKEFYNEVLAALPMKEYKELLSVKEKNTNVKMLYKNDSTVSHIGEFIILVHENDETTLVVIEGDSRVLSIENIQKMMDMKLYPGQKKRLY